LELRTYSQTVTTARRRLLAANGVFLIAVGGVQVTLELLAYYAGAGRRFWHGLAVAVHGLLGTANVLFWSSFGFFGMVPMGVAATAVHGGLVAAHGTALVLTRRESGALQA
jgi:hypothetical protein